MSKKVLAVTAEPIDGEALRSVIGTEDAEVLVIAPALNSKTRFWLSDPDPAIERAAEVATEAAERMEEQGVDAVGETGESDPVLAIQDALATFAADVIVLVTHPEGDRNWLEDGVVSDVRERFGERPVHHLVVE